MPASRRRRLRCRQLSWRWLSTPGSREASAVFLLRLVGGNPCGLWVVPCCVGGRRGGGLDAVSGDARLIGRARGGDIAAYEGLVRRYQDVVFRAACLITGDPVEAEDASQEAFVKAYRALGRFREGAPFGPWILAIASNEARNRRKAASRRVGLSMRAAEEPQRGDGFPQPEAAVLSSERRSELLQAVESLREEDRAVICCRYFLELSEAETAEVLGCARGTVKSRLSRALARLRGVMGREEDAG